MSRYYIEAKLDGEEKIIEVIISWEKTKHFFKRKNGSVKCDTVHNPHAADIPNYVKKQTFNIAKDIFDLPQEKHRMYAIEFRRANG